MSLGSCTKGRDNQNKTGQRDCKPKMFMYQKHENHESQTANLIKRVFARHVSDELMCRL